MAAQLELEFQYSSSSFLHLAQTTTRDKQNLNSTLNPMQTPDAIDDDDSWEVRAFAEDTANVMGTTWPPRSYTCTYCRREFRSAQALGGHMNVHRRDRARLHQAPLPNTIKPSSNISSSPSNSFIIPTPDFNGGGLCLLYQFPNPNTMNNNSGIINSPSSALNAYIHSPSSLFSMSHHSFNNFIIPSTTSPPSTAITSINNDHRAGPTTATFDEQQQQHFSTSSMENSNQELDLELRLGHGPSTQTLMENGHKICNLEAACLRKRSSD